MIRFSWVTNIPTPYRNHQFERMAEILPELGIEPTVHFMAWHEPDRPWRFERDELRYAWKLHRNPFPPLEHRAVHVNPGLIAELRYGGADAVMVGGWATPSHVAAAFALPRRTFKILGVESHIGSMVRRSGPAWTLKRAVMRRYDAYLVPGAPSRELLLALDPAAADKPCVTLPNVIDTRVFRDQVAGVRARRDALRAELGIASSTQLWVCPARLIPAKGLLEFVPQLAGLHGVELLIAGDGEQRAALTAVAAGLPVRLLGQQPTERMVELYAAADLFVLPSQSDPSPLSAVEAASAGLPLFMSNRCGNVGDLIDDGINGWVFDVGASAAARRAVLERVLATSQAELAAMGERSRALHARRFDADACVRTLGEFIVEHVSARRGR
jgi:glycosyltransferase involved in cell wall biosynthesis